MSKTQVYIIYIKWILTLVWVKVRLFFSSIYLYNTKKESNNHYNMSNIETCFVFLMINGQLYISRVSCILKAMKIKVFIRFFFYLLLEHVYAIFCMQYSKYLFIWGRDAFRYSYKQRAYCPHRSHKQTGLVSCYCHFLTIWNTFKEKRSAVKTIYRFDMLMKW